MNKRNSLSWIIHENVPCSSVAKSMLPGNAKCSMTKCYMTSLADTKHIFVDLSGHRNFCSWLRPCVVSRLCTRQVFKVATTAPSFTWNKYSDRLLNVFEIPCLKLESKCFSVIAMIPTVISDLLYVQLFPGELHVQSQLSFYAYSFSRLKEWQQLWTNRV